MDTSSAHNTAIHGRIVSINTSKKKGIGKTPVAEGKLVENWGLEGDIHAQEGPRQISLLALESIQKQKACPQINVQAANNLKPGDFAENITTAGIEASALFLGQKIKIGSQALIEITKIGKECHRYCSIYYKVGDCIMPREGVFAKVLKSGIIHTGDCLELVND